MLKNKCSSLAMISFGIVLAGFTGCAQTPKQENVYHGEQFRPDDEPRAVQTLMNTQTAAGARTDATLYPQHFDGGALSSLGKAKLDLMAQDSRSADPMKIFIAVPDDALSQDRRLAVGNYLIDHDGLKTEQIQFDSTGGPNPDTYAPAEPNLQNYSRTDTSLSGSTTGGAASGGSAQ
jgi:hypothetical protein